MALFKKIEDLRNKTAILVLFDLCFLIFPGTAVIFVARPDLVTSLDWVKLVLLSAAITAPLVISNSLAFAITEGNRAKAGEKEEEFFMVFTLAAFTTGFVIYVLLGAHYLFGLPGRSLLIFGILLEFLFFATSLWADRKK